MENSSLSVDYDSTPAALSGLEIVAVLTESLLAFLTVSVNLFILSYLFYLRRKERHETKDSLIIFQSMALADCLVGLFSMPLMSISTHFPSWPLGGVFCRVSQVIDYGLCNTSLFHICLIAWERHLAFTDPLQYHFRLPRKRIHLLISAAWSVSFVGAMMLTLMHLQVLSFQDSSLCVINMIKTEFIFFTVIYSVLFYQAPMVFIYAVYGFTMRQLLNDPHGVALEPERDPIYHYKNHLTIESDRPSYSLHIPRPNTRSKHPVVLVKYTVHSYAEQRPVRFIQHCSSHHDGRRNTAKRVARWCGTILIISTVCWWPWIIAWLINHIQHGLVEDAIYNWTGWMSYCSSTINPLVSISCSTKLKKLFKNCRQKACCGNK